MTKPLRSDARRNREMLISTAAAVFAERDVEAPLEDIARQAGVGIGTLYRHFPTRQALLEAVYIDQVESLSARAGELLRAESPADALAEWLRAMVKFSSTKRSMTTALLATGMVDVSPVITHRFALERFEEAFDAMASGRSGKVILLPQHPG